MHFPAGSGRSAAVSWVRWDLEKFAGPIETVRVFEDNTLVREALETPGRGRVLVVDGGGSLKLRPGRRPACRTGAEQWLVRGDRDQRLHP